MSDIDSAPDAALAETVKAICAEHGNRQDALIEILHDVQGGIGHVPEAAVEPLAACLNLSRADVHGVITFYHDFHRSPRGRNVIRICRAEACQANGCETLAVHAREVLGVDFGGTTADGEFTLESVYCLGNCALGPSLMIGGNLHARVDAERFSTLVRETRKSK